MYAEAEAKTPYREFSKPRKMNWFKKIVLSWVREDWEQAGRTNSAQGLVSVERDSPEQEPKLNFRVYPAIGGTIVEFRRIDRKIDRSESTLYIIGKDEDFGEKIAKIATLEHMK